MAVQSLDIPVAHVEDPDSVAGLLDALRALHGDSYDFAVGKWDGDDVVEPQPGRTRYRFIVSAENATADLNPGDLVRGPRKGAPYMPADEHFVQAAAAHSEALWPGDVVCVGDAETHPTLLHGQGVYFDVIAESTGYPAPKLSLLRNLTSKPGGCASYPGAFRRETLPPMRPAPNAVDRRGANRVNEHTLDMRFDRNPPPRPHYHGPVPTGEGAAVNHSETAIVLPRSAYKLREVGVPPSSPNQGRVVMYRRPAEDPTDREVIRVRPGSIVVTPATPEQTMGHAFENAFAMLIAIPGFVSPHNHIHDDEDASY